MKKSRLAILSSVAFGAAVIVNAPYAWSQASPGETGGQKSGSENRVQKPTDPPMSGGQSTPGQAGVSRGEGKGTQSGQWSKDKVKAIQEALKSKGFDPGTADGVVGPKTNQALRDFQKSNNLQATGRIDDKTASALGVEAGSMGSSSGKESASGSRGMSGRSSSSSEEKTGSQAGTTSNPPSKPTGRE
jgi:peptidoglycan hydrolase-like protein with peptidoglycan-binding domain